MTAESNTNEETLKLAEQAAGSEKGQDGASPEEIRQMLADEQKKAAEYLDSYQRARADFLNLKRRTEQERANLNAEARERLLLRILPMIDDFERALQNVPENLKKEPWVNGVTMIEKKIKNFLDQENVVPIEAEGQEFDPRLHEAVQHDSDSEGEKEVVSAVFQKGYKLGDKVIRAAVVKVGRK